MAKSPLRSHDRLCFAFILATVLHGTLIFSINPLSTEIEQKDSRMKVSFAQKNVLDTPINESLRKKANQHEITNEEKEVVSINAPNPRMEESAPSEIKHPSLNISIEDAPEQEKLFDTQAYGTMRINESFYLQLENYPLTSRVRTLNNLSPISNAESFYLTSWRRKIQNVGKINYPQEARKKKLYGSLRLMVTIVQDGSLKKVEIIESSGHKILDDAAINIVRLSSPFAPFPDDLRQSSDELRIIRTWQFKKNSAFESL